MSCDLSEAFDYYLRECRAGDREKAFFGMLHLGSDALPLIECAFANEPETDVRQFLIEIAWQTRDLAALPILAKALDDPEISVWKQATDGLVCLGTMEAADVLRAAKARDPSRRTGSDYTFAEWIDEALIQLSERSSEPSK